MIELQRVMYNLIETETKKLMLANGKPEYTFIVVDPAVAGELPIRPKRTQIFIEAVGLGFGLAFAWALIRELMKARKPFQQ
jgi:uncharacterized protein involved in exopolysaccharide biosynthesis